MKKTILYFLLLIPVWMQAQVTIQPALATPNSEITLTLNTTGTGLEGYTGDVYAHTGVTSNGNRWQHVIGSWGNNTTQPKLTKVNNTTYQLLITPDVYTYYGASTSENITELDFVFRSADGSKQTSPDIFITLYNGDFAVTFTNPLKNNQVYDLNNTITLSAEASENSELKLFHNGNLLKTVQNTSVISYDFTFNTTGNHLFTVEATNASETISDTRSSYVRTQTQNAPLPSGVENGLNKNADGSVTFVLTAPGKQDVFVIGDFNNWLIDANYQMKKDGDKFWLTVSGLNATTEYAYQYLVDYTLNVADPYSEKILDPYNDKYIPEETYPSIKAYPTDLTSGIVSVFTIDEAGYTWNSGSFAVSDKENLIVYEMHIRDFEVVNTDDIGDFKRAMQHLDYLEKLGVNAIELMPVSEFEGNDSWGYNPSFHGALDKAYGTKNDLKTFVDACHQRGIAVILDVVYNHAFYQCPLVQLYWDAANSRPAANNPWFNPIAKHDYNVGYDFNHESAYTKEYVKQTLKHWIEEFRIDGFRFDLSKGFTQKNTLGDVSAWGKYDASRIAILEDYADYIWSINPNSVNILEHFAENTEEKELSDYGFLLWGNLNYNYNQNTMGYASDTDISWISYKKRGWNDMHVLGYMESHDEERLMYKNLQFGNGAAGYNVKDLNTALAREELAANFFFTVPGPKMIWQFGELGYDYSIEYNGRTGRKPVKWDYFDDANRKKVYDTWARLIGLKKQYPVFQTTDFTLNINTLVKNIVLRHTDMDVVVVGNFDVTEKTVNPNFTQTGTWYEFFTGTQITVNNTTAPVTLAPGEYRLYSTKELQDPLPVEKISPENDRFTIYPNPAAGSFSINQDAVNVEIYDLTGRKVRSFKGRFTTGSRFNINHLKPSIYLVKIRSNAGTSVKRLIIE